MFPKRHYSEDDHGIVFSPTMTRRPGGLGAMMAAAAVIFLVLVLFSWARVQEKSALFFPSGDLHTLPSDLGLPFEEILFPSGKNTLHGWFIPGSGPGAVLWLHGNAGNISDRLDHAAAMRAELGVSSLLFDYRGYGKSGGRPSEKGLYEDAAAAFGWMTAEKGVDPLSVILYGHSLGSPVAVDLSLGEGKGAGGLVLESPFTSVGDVAKGLYGGLPVNLLMSVKLDNVGRIGKVSMPVLVIHGEEDATIPFKMGKEVFEAAPEPKDFLAVPGADHSDCFIVGGEKYWGEWEKLIKTSKGKNQNREGRKRS